ncbi:MAG: RidA family protein [Bradyrhizobium sp.]|uniref:RidA family protein n=1 Tax=Bradyrhizobium TaxID=374 RepID=UPI0012BBA952|nr:RidA family protein [Bradyrhizobium japonicum]
MNCALAIDFLALNRRNDALRRGASAGYGRPVIRRNPMPAAHIVSHNPATVHAPAGGYSMGFEISQHRRLLFVSGQVPETSDGSVPEGFEAQCEQAWRNVIEVLAAAGLGVRHLVKVTTFLTDIGQVVPNRVVRRRMLAGHEPALTVMIAQTVDSKWLLEIEAIAAE